MISGYNFVPQMKLLGNEFCDMKSFCKFENFFQKVFKKKRKNKRGYIYEKSKNWY